MPRPAKGPRLYLRRGRVDSRTGRALPDVWFIRDGAREVGTGCGPDRMREAEQALAQYIAAKWAPPARAGRRGPGEPPDGPSRPADVLVADVLTLYARERAPQLADPVSAAGWIRTLTLWWGARTLADVRRSTCQAYAAHRTAQPRVHARSASALARKVSSEAARRELEVLSAAIGWWHAESPLEVRPEVWLPEKPQSPRDALTRRQAAALLKASLGHRRDADGAWRRLGRAARANRAHLRRLILIGLYTGTRSGVIRALLWEESPRQAWVDLERRMIWRRGREERDRPTKRRPVVKLPARLAAHLARWKRLDAAEAERRAAAAAKRGETPGPMAGTVLHHGGAAIAGKTRTGFAAIVADAGLPPDVTPHWLRHTAATWLMESDVDLWAAAGYLGMTAATLEKHYGHHRPSHQAEAAAATRKRA